MADIEYFRMKGGFYHSLRLFEAEKYANSLASNIELALTTMSFDDGMKLLEIVQQPFELQLDSCKNLAVI